MTMHGMGGGMFSQGIFWIVLIVVAIWAVKYFVDRDRGRSQPSPNKQDSALKTLRKCYARGEIDREEFEQKSKDLLT